MPGTAFTSGPGVTPLVFSVEPSYPGRVVLHSGTARAATEGGGEYVYQKGPGYLLHTLKFDCMPASDFDGGYDYGTGVQAEGTQSLVNWFLNVSGAGLTEFTYQDPFGGEHQVSIADDRLEFSMTDHGLYGGVIALKERLG